MLEYEKNCTILIRVDAAKTPPTATDIQKRLENPNNDVKVLAMEELLLWMQQEDSLGKLLMTVMRFVVPSNNHRIKKLLQLYWEIVDKCKSDGTLTLKDEMILVCNGLLQDLLHANEYVRGSTLRLLRKIRYWKILEPLTDAVIKNLSHRHSYVRRNAVMCVYSIVKSFGTEALPHASEEVEKLLFTETDLSTKRNAFLMLFHCDCERALNYVLTVQEGISRSGDIFQLSTLALVRRVCRQNPSQKGVLLRIVVELVESCPPAVAYDAAATLVSLTSSPVAIKAATQAYVNLLCNQADNNVRLIVLDRLAEMMKKHQHILEKFTMDILRALRLPSMEVRRRTLDIALKLVSPRTIHDVVTVLRKEIMRSMETEEQTSGTALEYRRLLIRTVHSASSKFPDVAQSVMQLLMDFVGESDAATTTDVALFIRELTSNYPHLRPTILQRVAESLADIQQSRVLRVCLWVLGEFCDDAQLAEQVVDAVHSSLLPLPISAAECQQASGLRKGQPDERKPTENTAPQVRVTTRTVVLEDGTYGTEDVLAPVDENAATGRSKDKDRKTVPMRTCILEGDVLLTSMICVALTKIVLRHTDMDNKSSISPASKAKVMLAVASLLKLTKEAQKSMPDVASDATIRITQCMRSLLSLSSNQPKQVDKLRAEWFKDVRESLAKVHDTESRANIDEPTSAFQGPTVEIEDESAEADEIIGFRQLRERIGPATDGVDEDELDLQTAIGSAHGAQGAEDGAIFQQRLAKVQQMTGLADPVYVEAFIQVLHFDLLVELLVINRTAETLQNVNVELSTHGDLKLVDRPAAVTLASGQSVTVHASIKVQSTETGVIFGYVTYDKRSAADKECLVLNELHIELLDYIERSWINEMTFRSMWSEFEWENKINVNTTITDVSTFLEHIMRNTNMTVVGKYANLPAKTTAKEMSSKKASELYLQSVKDVPMLKTLMSNSHFFAVNLYSRSIFGEDALANVSIEKLPDGKLAGSVRIRSRTQGIALSLGDRIAVIQRAVQSERKSGSAEPPPA